MQVVAKLNYLRIAPRKVRLVADLVRRKRAAEAQAILRFVVKKGTNPVLKLLNSACANAKNNFQLDINNLFISKITVDEGPKYKRWMPRARGSAYEIQKKTSHITLILDEIKPTSGKANKKPAKEKVGGPAKEISEGVVKMEGEAEKKVPEVKKLRPETEKPKPKAVKGIRRIFQRKAF